MKPAIIVLNYKRYDLAAKTLIHNLPIAGCEYGIIVVEEYGLAKALNVGLARAMTSGYDMFMFMGNDILEPLNYLQRRLSFLESHPKAGIASIGFEFSQPSSEIVIGNYLITKELVDTIGCFDQSFDPYGAIDLDYCNRANKAGFESWYIGGDPAQHIGNHGEEDKNEIYGFNKAEMIAKTWQKHVDSTNEPGYTILQNQFLGE